MGYRESERTLARTRRRRNRWRYRNYRRKPGIPGHSRRASGGLHCRQGRKAPRRSDRTSRRHGPPHHLYARRQAVRRTGRRLRGAPHLWSSPRCASGRWKRPGTRGTRCTACCSRCSCCRRGRSPASSPRIRRTAGYPQAPGFCPRRPGAASWHTYASVGPYPRTLELVPNVLLRYTVKRGGLQNQSVISETGKYLPVSVRRSYRLQNSVQDPVVAPAGIGLRVGSTQRPLMGVASPGIEQKGPYSKVSLERGI
jgi:hypothetical protein